MTMLFSKQQVNKAGQMLLVAPRLASKLQHWEILTAFRLMHVHPMLAFRNFLDSKLQKIGGRNKALLTQRLKRNPSIMQKLKLHKNMNLSRMQDIGGIRVVVPVIGDVYKLRDEIKKAGTHRSFQSTLVREYDYIAKPKSSGYKSLHMVYKHGKNLPAHQQCLIEVQIRTSIQHAWATAVEIMGIYYNQPLKQSFGSKVYLSLFSDISKGFACLETGQYNPELFREIAGQVAEEKFMDRMGQIRNLTTHLTQELKLGNRVTSSSAYLIVLDVEKPLIKITEFPKSKLQDAALQYQEQEIANANNRKQVVLVSVNDVKKIQNSYPNYFLDMQNFLTHLQKITRFK